MREWVFAREALRRLGFQPDELFLVVQPDGRICEQGKEFRFGKPVLILRLCAQGKQWDWTVSTTDLRDSEIQGHFEAACELWNSADAAWLDRGWLSSLAFQHRVALTGELVARGFRLPIAEGYNAFS